MRHNKSFNHLSRTSSHRRAMLSNMATSLILHKRITTTTAKAKALRMYVEPIMTRSKEDSTHSRRMVFNQLRSKEAVSELFRNVAGKIANRPGGYTRILKLGTRPGDAADVCMIELVDYNENMLASKPSAAAEKAPRTRRSAKKKTEEAKTADVVEDATIVESEETKVPPSDQATDSTEEKK